MLLHTPSLLVAFALILVLASAASVSVGLKQQSRRGARWWVVANAVFAAALTLHAGTDASAIGAPIAAVLALQWPIVMLGGVRRFYSRGGTRISEWSDRIVLIVAMVLTVGAWGEPILPVSYAQVHAMASLSLTLYVATAVGRLEDFATSSTLRALRLGLVAAAIVQLAWLAVMLAYLSPLIAVGDAALGALLSTAVMALMMTQLSLVMNHERRIAHLLASQRTVREAQRDRLGILVHRDRGCQRNAIQRGRRKGHVDSVEHQPIGRLKHLDIDDRGARDRERLEVRLQVERVVDGRHRLRQLAWRRFKRIGCVGVCDGQQNRQCKGARQHPDGEIKQNHGVRRMDD